MLAPLAAPTAASAAVLSALLLAACAHDVRARRIPNTLVLATLGAGVARAAAVQLLPTLAGTVGPALAPGVVAALLGALLALAAWLPLYALGALGAGDVKLFAAAAAWLGPQGVLPATVYAALAGGALAAVWVARGLVARRARTPGAPGGARHDARLPYGVAVAAGVLAVAWGAA